MTTGRRRWATVAMLMVIVAASAAAVTITVRHDSSDNTVDPRAALLQQGDFPSGYVVSEIEDSDDGPPPPGTVTPSNCQGVLDEQFARNAKRTTLNTIIDDATQPDRPRFAQTVASNGESVDEAISVVRDCPRHTNRDADGTVSVAAMVASPPANCPTDAKYVRLTASQTRSGAETPTATDYLMAYVQSGPVVSTLTQILPTTGQPDFPVFCTLVDRARDRLNK